MPFETTPFSSQIQNKNKSSCLCEMVSSWNSLYVHRFKLQFGLKKKKRNKAEEIPQRIALF